MDKGFEEFGWLIWNDFQTVPTESAIFAYSDESVARLITTFGP